MISRHFQNVMRTSRNLYSYSTSEIAKAVKRGKSNDTEFTRTKINNFDIVNETLRNRTIKTKEDWKVVRTEILDCNTHITKSNIDAMIVGFYTSNQEYEKALDYIHYLKEDNMKPNLATIGKYFKLVFLTNQEKELAKSEEDYIFKAYKELRKSYPILDAITLENIIDGLSITKHWKLCLNMLDEVKVSGIPSGPAYSAVISAAFLNKEDDIAWKLFNELLENERDPSSFIYSSYLKSIEKRSRKKESLLKKLELLFMFLQKNDLKFKEENITELTKFLEKHGLQTNISKISLRGICKCCSRNLLKFDPTDSEFNDLKKKIFNNVIVGKDVFNKTTPEELADFKNFVAKGETYDVVIDGLNVAYCVGTKHQPRFFTFMLYSVVKYFKDKGKKVLVLGRSHMDIWPQFALVKNLSTVFLTADVSHDDPYFLYYALNSGRNTIVVTKDLMRNHKFLLKHHQLKVLFNRWLTHHQYQLKFVDDKGKVIFKVPLPYTCTAQKNENYWHIPFEVEKQNMKGIKYEKDTKEIITNWLCIPF